MVLNHVDSSSFFQIFFFKFFSSFFFFFFFFPHSRLQTDPNSQVPCSASAPRASDTTCRQKPKTLRHRSSAVSIAGTVTKVWWRQTRACLDKHVFVTAKHVFCRDKGLLVATKFCLSLQAYFGRDKRRALSRQARACRDKSIFLSRGKTCLS